MGGGMGVGVCVGCSATGACPASEQVLHRVRHEAVGRQILPQLRCQAVRLRLLAVDSKTVCSSHLCTTV